MTSTATSHAILGPDEAEAIQARRNRRGLRIAPLAADPPLADGAALRRGDSEAEPIEICEFLQSVCGAVTTAGRRRGGTT